MDHEMVVDLLARFQLRSALVDYMNGTIRTYAFDDQNWLGMGSSDRSVQKISRQLWGIHDDFADHPISVSSETWNGLRRIVAYLYTDLEISDEVSQSFWPFPSEEEWRLNKYLLNEIELPDYDPDLRNQWRQPWWNRIPSSVGFLILAVLFSTIFICLIIL